MLSLPNLPTSCSPSPRSPPLNRPQCVMLPSLCPCVLIVQHLPTSENMQYFIFCSCVSLLRMMFSRFIHVPTKDMNSCTQMFIAVLFTIEKTWNQPTCPLMIDWTGKMWHIYTMEYYAAIKSYEFVVLYRDMDEPGEHHCQQTDTRTENEIPHILTHRRVRKNENTWTQGREYYTSGSTVGNGEGQRCGGAGEG